MKQKFVYQEVFNKVKSHLLKQGKKAVNGDICAYRSEDGMQCAVGCLIPDNLYNKNIENDTVSAKKVRKCLPFTFMSSEMIGFLRDLQRIHDNNPVPTWEEDLNALAKEYSLKV